MGMLSNTIFRIKIHRMKDAEGLDAIWFEHPTMPGAETGGWMTEEAGKFDASIASEAAAGSTGTPPSRTVAAVWKAEEAAAVIGSASASAAAVVPKQVEKAVGSNTAGKLVKSTPEWLSQGISMEEVEKHNDEKSVWFVVKGRVYDGTPFLEKHPGGASSMLIVGGQEASEDFEAVHSKAAWAQLEDHYIGRLRESDSATASAVVALRPSLSKLVGGALRTLASPLSGAFWRPAAPMKVFLNPRMTQQLPLVEKIIVSEDARIFRFALPSKTMRLGLPTGMHIFLKAKVDGEAVMRPYTPMTDDETLGHVDFLVKVYFAGVHPAFPKGGKMSQHLESMKIGDTIDVKGPLGEFIYKGKGDFLWHNKPRSCKRISMIAGGTGLTPCYQVLSAVLRDPNDTTEVALLYANRTPADILAREQLEKLAAEHPKRFRLSFTVDRLPEGEKWSHNVGFISKAMIEAALFAAGPDTISVLCGPPIMLEKACFPPLRELGYEDANVFSF
ncbi:unnamed protein product [Polarella glacialis]|uniref:Cytochrome-b5 reductase n=1 Tax=Polarella glacialis TaxID=89957 RepID=A0A813HNZ6_POLGL|nr:unnamed protein product [Polarella glacialis]